MLKQEEYQKIVDIAIPFLEESGSGDGMVWKSDATKEFKQMYRIVLNSMFDDEYEINPFTMKVEKTDKRENTSIKNFMESLNCVMQQCGNNFQDIFGFGVDYEIKDNKIVFETELGVFELSCKELPQPEEGFYINRN